MSPAPLPRHTAHRYVQPLREGGSLPAIVDTDDGLYVVKFRGAGQGPRALVAELIVGRLAQALGLPTPDLAIIDIPPPFGRSEPDPEIQDLLRASHGTNVGLRYLDGAFNFALAAARDLVTSDFASRLVWLDAFVTNPDRTHRNTNLLVCHRELWLIDHGAALYAHHDWNSVDEARTGSAFPLIRDHVLITACDDIQDIDDQCAAMLTHDVLRAIVDAVPDDLLADPTIFSSPSDARDRYVRYLAERLRAPREFIAEAARARDLARSQPETRLRARR
ncbi:MAG TPA: HipA family kinase [Longimicrobiales bacterium]|nr:HipA family kinase [Longimicrobiales bacterium]